MASKRTTKKELGQPDAFQTGIDRLWERITKYQSELKIAAVIIVVLIAAGFAMNISSASKEKAAQSLIEKLAGDYQEVVAVDSASLAATAKDESGKAEKSQKVEAGLKEIIEKHGSTKAAHLANFYLGELYFSQKKFTDAQPYFKAYEKKLSARSPFRALVLSNLGYTFEAQNKFAEAAEYFVQSAAIKDNPSRDRDLFNAARLFEQVQKNDQASKYYQTIIDEFPDSSLVLLAKNKIAKLKG